MTRKDLIDYLAEKTGFKKNEVSKFLDQLTITIQNKVAAGEKVNITGFGTFDVSKRSERKGVDPQTKTPITIPEMKVPHFRAGSNFKQAVK